MAGNVVGYSICKNSLSHNHNQNLSPMNIDQLDGIIKYIDNFSFDIDNHIIDTYETGCIKKYICFFLKYTFLCRSIGIQQHKAVK